MALTLHYTHVRVLTVTLILYLNVSTALTFLDAVTINTINGLGNTVLKG